MQLSLTLDETQAVSPSIIDFTQSSSTISTPLFLAALALAESLSVVQSAVGLEQSQTGPT